MKRTLQLREERAALVQQARALLDQPKTTREDEEKFDRMMADIDALKAQIDRLEKLEQIEQEVSARLEQRAGIAGVSVEQIYEKDQKESEVFSKWMKGGMDPLNADERAYMASRYQVYGAMGVGSGAGGGYLVPQGFADRVDIAMKTYGQMLSVVDVMTTESGVDIPHPTVNDTTVVGELLSENTQAASEDVAVGQVVVRAYMFSSRLIPVSIQLAQDSAFSVDDLVANIAGERLGRAINSYCTTGTGSSQPQGVVTACAIGVTGATGQTTTVTYDDLVDLKMSVDAAYRANGVWMMHDTSIGRLMKLKTTTDEPLWMPSLVEGTPDRFMGRPVVPNNDVPTMAANARSILFGDFRKYKVRRVRGISVMRLVERYADYLQIGFLAFVRADGRLIDAGTGPIKCYRNSAT